MQRTVDGSVKTGATSALDALKRTTDLGAADVNEIEKLFSNAIYIFLTQRKDIDAMIVDAVTRNLSLEQRNNQ